MIFDALLTAVVFYTLVVVCAVIVLLIQAAVIHFTDRPVKVLGDEPEARVYSLELERAARRRHWHESQPPGGRAA